MIRRRWQADRRSRHSFARSIRRRRLKIVGLPRSPLSLSLSLSHSPSLALRRDNRILAVMARVIDPWQHQN